jgi:hypothetical protein
MKSNSIMTNMQFIFLESLEFSCSQFTNSLYSWHDKGGVTTLEKLAPASVKLSARRSSMRTVTETLALRNPKAYHATYLGLSGILTKPADTALFLESKSGAVVTLTPEEVLRDVVINGVMADAMVQYIQDMARGGYAAVACNREEGVS